MAKPIVAEGTGTAAPRMPTIAQPSVSARAAVSAPAVDSLVIDGPLQVPLAKIRGPIEDRIGAYLNKYLEHTRPSALRIDVGVYDPGERILRYMFPFLAGAARVQLKLSGTLKNVPVEKEASAAHRMGLFFGGNSEVLVGDCLQRCLDAVIFKIDEASGREPIPFVRLLDRMKPVKWLLAAIAGVVYFAAYYLFVMTKAAFPNPAAGILLALLVSLASYGLIACALLGASPRAFLVDEPRGESIMRKVGVQSPFAFRFAMFFTVALMPAILWLCTPVF